MISLGHFTTFYFKWEISGMYNGEGRVILTVMVNYGYTILTQRIVITMVRSTKRHIECRYRVCTKMKPGSRNKVPLVRLSENSTVMYTEIA